LALQGFEQSKRLILDRVDLVEFVSEHVVLRRQGRRMVGLCPFHSEKTPSFTVSPELGLFKCFGCGKGGDLFSFVQERENVTFMEAMRILADRAGVELAPSRGSGKAGSGAAPTIGRVEIARVNEWAARWFRANLLDAKLGARVRDYAAARGISEAASEQFELGLADAGAASIIEAGRRAGFGLDLLDAADLIRRGDDGRVYETFRNRLMFPIRDVMRRVIGFGGRTLVDDRAKYLNTRQHVLFDKGRSLYGIDRARDAVASQGRIVIVEGYTDCIAAHQAGFCETVATLGTALTEHHVDLIRRYTEHAVLLFDSDDAGAAAADRAITVALPRCLNGRLARIPSGKDPSDFLATHEASAFSDVLNGAVEALEFKWLQIESRFLEDASDATRRDAVLEFLRIVAEGADGHAVDAIQRGLMVNQVAHLLRMDRAEVDATLSRLRPRRAASGRPVAANVPRTSPDTEFGEQRDWARVLEVILNEPGLLADAGAWPDLNRIVDPRDRRIAEVALELADRLGEFRLVDVLGALSDPETANRACDLAQRGAERFRHERELCDALTRIRRRIAADDLEIAKRRVREAGEAAQLTEGCADGAVLREGMGGHRHFVPQRLRRKAGGGIGG